MFVNIKDRSLKTAVLDEVYTNGSMIGCFLPEDDGDEGKQARLARDQFRSVVGNNRYSFQGNSRLQASPGYNGIDGCHVYTGLAFNEFERHNDGYANWLFACLQNSGCCVGDSGTEMFDDLLGKLSANLANIFKMVCKAAKWIYAYRDHCGQGWYMGSHATQARLHGWCPATIFDGRKLGTLIVPDYNGLQYSKEQESEDLVTNTWCRGRVPDVLEEWVEANFMFGEGAITELTDASGEVIKRMAELQGDIHHGSNYTANRGGLDSIRRISGHAQTNYGADWSDPCIEWFEKWGIKCSTTDFIMPHGQTWGGGWSGEIADEYWPFGSDSQGHVYSWADVQDNMNNRSALFDMLSMIQDAGGWGWGPKHQGAWVTTLSTFQKYLTRSAYVYLPDMQGVPTDTPIDPEPPVNSLIQGKIHGEMLPNGNIAIRGDVTTQDVDHIAIPVGNNEFSFARKL